MALNEDMKAFFETHDIEKVFSDENKFVKKLKISEGACKGLKKAKDLEAYGATIAAGLAGASLAYIGWLTTLGFIGQLGLIVGLGVTPVGWIALAGGGGAVLMYGLKGAIDKLDESAYEKTPKFLNTPLDILGTTLMSIMLPLALKLIIVNGKLSKDSINDILKEFIDLGYDENYVKQTISSQLKVFGALKIEGEKQKLGAMAKATDGLECDNLTGLVKEFLENIFEKQEDKSNFRVLNDISVELSFNK